MELIRWHNEFAVLGKNTAMKLMLERAKREDQKQQENAQQGADGKSLGRRREIGGIRA
jgi:hypothetical protein